MPPDLTFSERPAGHLLRPPSALCPLGQLRCREPLTQGNEYLVWSPFSGLLSSLKITWRVHHSFGSVRRWLKLHHSWTLPAVCSCFVFPLPKVLILTTLITLCMSDSFSEVPFWGTEGHICLQILLAS